MEELLFTGGESKRSPAIGALERFALKNHWVTSSLLYYCWSSGHPILDLIYGDLIKNEIT
jgi:hypothetical protein